MVSRWLAVAILGLGATAAACVGNGEDPFEGRRRVTSTASTGEGGGGSTSGTGGEGGATIGTGGASTSSSTGAGGACAESSDCAGYPGPACAQVACVAGSCAVVKPALGTPTTDATAGDCHRAACDGQGGVVELVDASDIPEDGNDCTIDACDAQGKAWNTKLPAGAACSSNGGKVCDGAGACAECLTDADCGDPPDPCDFYFDQFKCQAVPGCAWDSASWSCSGAPTGYTCQGGSCI